MSQSKIIAGTILAIVLIISGVVLLLNSLGGFGIACLFFGFIIGVTVLED